MLNLETPWSQNEGRKYLAGCYGRSRSTFPEAILVPGILSNVQTGQPERLLPPFHYYWKFFQQAEAARYVKRPSGIGIPKLRLVYTGYLEEGVN